MNTTFKTIGILAHVDAGKTTLSERILFETNSIHSLGNVNKQTSFLDTNTIERQRGITIFSDQAIFYYHNSTYQLIDTPGHMDFSAEAERAILSLDYAILLISGSSFVESHTSTLFKILQMYQVPTFFFVTKMDQPNADLNMAINSIKEKLAIHPLVINQTSDLLDPGTELVEQLLDHDDVLLERYMDSLDNSNKVITVEEYQHSLRSNFKNNIIYPLMYGSAVSNTGIEDFLYCFDFLTDLNDHHENSILIEEYQPFSGQVYKIRHDTSGERITFIKCLKGHLKIKDELTFHINDTLQKEKINQIRKYNGSKFTTQSTATVGEIIGVTGLSIPRCGDTIGESYKQAEFLLQPTLESKVKILDLTNEKTVYTYFKLLEEEDPLLQVSYQQELKEIRVRIMGEIQLQVLKQYCLERFSIQIDFESPEILYQETIASAVTGYGHFEPLKHYAEVHVELEPTPRGSGITFANKCSTDLLTKNFQNAVRTHVFEKKHLGILTGSLLTDIKITLINGRAHEKHTEGGDFREATYRAIRQGIEKAQGILLEPYYKFKIFIPSEYLGKVISQINERSGNFEAPLQLNDHIQINGTGPVATFLNYTTDLIAATNGTGTIHYEFSGYDQCHNQEEVINIKNYNKNADPDNTSSSVFCSKGQSFIVPWDKAEEYMHCL